MEALIVQQAKILDPKTVPGYMDEVARYMEIMSSGVNKLKIESREGVFPFSLRRTEPLDIASKQTFLPEEDRQYSNAIHYPNETIPLEEFRRITNRAAMGAVLYRHALEYLKPLSISRIFNLRGAEDEQVPRGISSIWGIKNNINSISWTNPEFYAKINPPFGAGANKVRIRMSNYPPSKYNSRAVTIDAKFNNPQAASLGINGLRDVFQETIFKEELFAGELPRKITELYIRNDNYLFAHLDYTCGYTDTETHFNETAYRDMTRETCIKHLDFLNPHLRRIEITPHTATYHDAGSNLQYIMPVGSFYEVADLIEQGYYDGSDIPNIMGTFDGREIELDFRQWAWGSGLSKFALKVVNTSKVRALEDILRNVRS